MIFNRIYKRNLKQNALSVLSIVLTSLLLLFFTNIGVEYYGELMNRSLKMGGAIYDLQVPEPTNKQIELAKKDKRIKDVGVALKTAVVDEVSGKVTNIRLFWCDEEAWNFQYKPAVENFRGTYPKNKNEIVLSKSELRKIGIDNPKIGMVLPQISYHSTAIDYSQSTRFVLSGFFDDLSSEKRGFVSKEFSDEMNAKLTDETLGIMNITLKNHIYDEKDMKSIGKEIQLNDNQIIYGDPDTAKSFYKTISGVLLLIIIVFFCGGLFIYNVLNIYHEKNMNIYGQLRILGLKKKEVICIYAKQVLVNGIMGLLIGYISGYFIISKTSKLKIESLAYVAFFVVIILLYVLELNYKKIKNLSSYDMFNYTLAENCTIKQGKGKGNLFSVAVRNNFRDRGKAMIIIMSLSISLTVFLIVNSFIEGNKAKNILNNEYVYDLRLINMTIPEDSPKKIITKDLIKRIKNKNDVEKVWTIRSNRIYFPYKKVFDSYYKELSDRPGVEGSYKSLLAGYKKDCSNYNYEGNLISITKDEFIYYKNKYKLNTSWKKFNSGKAVWIRAGLDTSAAEFINKKLSFGLEGSSNINEVQVVEDVGNIQGINYAASGWGPDIIVGENFYKSCVKNDRIEILDIFYKKSYDHDLEEDILSLINNDDIDYNSKLQEYGELETVENQIRKDGNLLVVFFMVMAFANYINITVSGIENRAKEFAIMRSVGMTKKQLKQMLIMEGIIYFVIAFLVTVLVGGPVSLGIYKLVVNTGVNYSLSIKSLIDTLSVFILLCISIPNVVYSILPEKSIVENLNSAN